MSLKNQNDAAMIMELFNDIMCLNQVFLINKNSGICAYFWSNNNYHQNLKNLDDILSTIFEFGTRINAQATINNIKCGSYYHIAIADGHYFRIAVVQSKKPSLLFRFKIQRLLKSIEAELKGSKKEVSLNIESFNKIESIIQDELYLSLLLAYKINYDYENSDKLLEHDTTDVLKIANILIQEYKSPFFFIPILVREISEKMDITFEQILHSVVDLQKLNIIEPIKIQQTYVSPSKKQFELIERSADYINPKKLVAFIETRTPIEREIFFFTLVRRKKIVSPPIKVEDVAIRIESVKSARKNLEDLKKKVKSALKKKDFEIIKILYREAIRIACYWNLAENLKFFINVRRLVKIEENKKKLEQFKARAENAQNAGHANQASHYFSLASEVAYLLYHLGDIEIYDDLCVLAKQKNQIIKL
ncbi:MAG: hypothetical protein JW891_01275 [Candidatus Lokiarchaeota archaeon]|nr:hypothetical protein [Candidatus Lokiarchaeota archaeon]